MRNLKIIALITLLAAVAALTAAASAAMTYEDNGIQKIFATLKNHEQRLTREEEKPAEFEKVAVKIDNRITTQLNQLEKEIIRLQALLSYLESAAAIIVSIITATAAFFGIRNAMHKK